MRSQSDNIFVGQRHYIGADCRLQPQSVSVLEAFSTPYVCAIIRALVSSGRMRNSYSHRRLMKATTERARWLDQEVLRMTPPNFTFYPIVLAIIYLFASPTIAIATPSDYLQNNMIANRFVYSPDGSVYLVRLRARPSAASVRSSNP